MPRAGAVPRHGPHRKPRPIRAPPDVRLGWAETFVAGSAGELIDRAGRGISIGEPPNERRRTPEPTSPQPVESHLAHERGEHVDPLRTLFDDAAPGRDRGQRRRGRSPCGCTAEGGRATDLDQPVPIPRDVPWFPRDVDFWSARWVLLHLIEETARHAGQADIIRESIDGATFYELMAAAEA